MSATAAIGRYPFTDHRTVAELWSKADAERAEMRRLDSESRTRALREDESRRLEQLVNRYPS